MGPLRPPWRAGGLRVALPTRRRRRGERRHPRRRPRAHRPPPRGRRANRRSSTSTATGTSRARPGATRSSGHASPPRSADRSRWSTTAWRPSTPTPPPSTTPRRRARRSSTAVPTRHGSSWRGDSAGGGSRSPRWYGPATRGCPCRPAPAARAGSARRAPPPRRRRAYSARRCLRGPRRAGRGTGERPHLADLPRPSRVDRGARRGGGVRGQAPRRRAPVLSGAVGRAALDRHRCRTTLVAVSSRRVWPCGPRSGRGWPTTPVPGVGVRGGHGRRACMERCYGRGVHPVHREDPRGLARRRSGNPHTCARCHGQER